MLLFKPQIFVLYHNSKTKALIKKVKTCGPSLRSTLANGMSYSYVRSVSIEKLRDKRRWLSLFCFILEIEIQLKEWLYLSPHFQEILGLIQVYKGVYGNLLSPPLILDEKTTLQVPSNKQWLISTLQGEKHLSHLRGVSLVISYGYFLIARKHCPLFSRLSDNGLFLLWRETALNWVWVPCNDVIGVK